MMRELVVILMVVAYMWIGARGYNVHPGFLMLGALGLWTVVRMLELAYGVRQLTRAKAAEQDAWRARRAQGIKKLEDAARQARNRT